MKPIRSLLTSLCISVFLLFSASGFSAQAESVNLKFADSFPLEHYLSSEGMVWWMERVTELTEGGVTFTHFPAEQIAKAGNILQKVRDGVVDAGYIGIGYVTDRMPLNGVAMLPGLSKNALVGSLAYWDLVKNGPLRKEFKENGIVPLFAVVLPSYQLVLNSGPVETLDGFQGLKIRAPGIMGLSAAALGATPMNVAAPEIYLGMQRGTINGTLLPAISVMPYNLHEVTNSVSSNGAFGTFAVTAGMRIEAFQSLTEAQQEAIMQAGDDTVRHLATYMATHEQATQKKLSEMGITVYEFSPELLAKMQDKLEKVHEKWAARMAEQGLDGKAAIEAFKQRLEAHRQAASEASES